jgi:hypothetical protein
MNTSSRSSMKAFALLVAMVGFGTGCASVQPWQRGSLAERSMRPDHDQLENSLAEHMWFSREAASGGRGIGGGGCGCN